MQRAVFGPVALVASNAADGFAADSLLCHAIAAPETATDELMYMPGGVQTITPSHSGKAIKVEVLIEPASAEALEAQRQAIFARTGKKPYFDFDHKDERASFWPERFVWRDGAAAGVYAHGEWTGSGRAAIQGKDYRGFSPVFHVNNVRAKPAHIVCRESADPNMGGLVNDPAFNKILPLWAKSASGAQQSSSANPNENDTMNPQEIAALQARNRELLDELNGLKAQQAAIKAKNENDALVLSKIAAHEQEIKANELKLQLEGILATNKKQSEAIKARNETDAKTEVDAAVKRGAIAAKDQKTIDALVAKATEDPDFLPVIKAMAGNAALGGRITESAAAIEARRAANGDGGHVVRGRESVKSALKAFGAVIARNASIPLSYATSDEKHRLALEAASIFGGDFEDGKALLAMSMEDALQAADFADPGSNLGLLSGTLVLQSTLQRMQFEYPMINSVFTDFSAAPARYLQTEVTRIVLTPAVQTFNPAADTSGRPQGWSTVSPAQTVDVPITLNEYVGIPIVFGNTTLAETARNLFGEIASQALYALGGYFVQKLLNLLTPANFNAYASTSATGGATSAGSPVITYTANAGLYPGQLISGAGIPANTFVLSVQSNTSATLNQPATAAANGLTFTLGGTSTKVPTTYPTYAVAQANFNMGSLAVIGAALSNNEVPRADRSVMLNASYYAQLALDPSFNTFFAATRAPGIITDRLLPRLQGFNPMEAPYMAAAGVYRVGFAYHKAAAALKSRLPMDVSQALPGVPLPGSVSTITDPATGLSLLLAQHVSLTGMYAEWRPEIMLGAAVGERRAGLVLTSQ